MMVSRSNSKERVWREEGSVERKMDRGRERIERERERRIRGREKTIKRSKNLLFVTKIES